MPSKTILLLRSIRRWILLSTVLLGIGVVILTGLADENLRIVSSWVGGAIALAAAGQFVRTYLYDLADNRPSAE